MEGEADIETNILVSNISVKSVFTLYIFVFISVFIRGVTVHLFVPNHFDIRIQYLFFSSGNSNNKCRFGSL